MPRYVPRLGVRGFILTGALLINIVTLPRINKVIWQIYVTCGPREFRIVQLGFIFGKSYTHKSYA